MKTALRFVALALFFGLSGFFFSPGIAKADGTVPPAYQALYDYTKSRLDGFQAKLSKLKEVDAPTPLVFGTDLSFANDNIGPALLQPDALERVKKQLDALQVMGVGGVHVTIQWPLLSATHDPDFKGYLAFYQAVAAELKARRILFFAHNTVLFGPPFSGYNHGVPKITFTEYLREKRLVAETIINELHPDYLILGSEPGTEAHNSGIPELAVPEKAKTLINYVINGDGAAVPPLKKGNTLVGAGTGSWDAIDFDRNYVTIPNLNFISLHIYPIDGRNIEKAVAMAQLAHDNHKRLILDEVGLYKTDKNDAGASVAMAPEIYKRDVFSFFEPLDERFISCLTELARKTHAEFLSFFWFRNMIAYIDYKPGDENRSYAQLQRAINQASFQNLDKNVLSPLGEYYKKLIAETTGKK
jgi:hypothetical protein